MKRYIGGLYVFISIVIIYWMSIFLLKTTSIETFEEISDYQKESEFLKSLEGKDLKPKKRSLNLKASILPQLEGTYQGINDMKDTYWKMDTSGRLLSVYGLYGTLTMVSPQKVENGFVSLTFTDKANKKYQAGYDGSQLMMMIGSKPFMIQLIDDPTITPLTLSDINAYIGNVKDTNQTQYYVSKEGILLVAGTNRPIGQLKYSSAGPPYKNKDGSYTFQIEYLDQELKTTFGTDLKQVKLSKTQLNIYNKEDTVATYTKVIANPPPAPAPPPSREFGFKETTVSVLEGCRQTSLGESSYYEHICIDRPYYIINYDGLLCLSVGPDGKTLVMQPIDKNNPKQIWIPRQYRIEDRYNYYDNEWCQTDLEAEEEARNMKYDELNKRGKWMRPESIYPRNPPRNKILQPKIDYRISNNNADFLLESSTTRSFVKGEFNPKTTLLELSLIPATIQTKQRKGYDFNQPIYENISPNCLYKCDTSKPERDKILESDTYTLSQSSRNCAGDPCAERIDPPCRRWDRKCWWEPWYYERPVCRFNTPFGCMVWGSERTYGGQRYVCGGYYCADDPPPYCANYKCADTRTQQFNGKYQPIVCNDKYENYDKMARFRFEGNLLEVVTRVADKYNSLAVQNRQYIEANDKECLITYSDAKTDAIRVKRTWYFIPANEIDRILPKLKERKRNLALEKQIDTNVKNFET